MMLIRVGAWLAVLTIVVLSVVPGNLRPHLLGNDYFEHLAAYFVAGSLFAIGFPRPMQQLASWTLLATCAGVLELVQRSIPDRTASIGEFAIGVFGAGLGIMAILVIRQVLGGRSALLPFKLNSAGADNRSVEANGGISAGRSFSWTGEGPGDH
jgi:hypothetical protein